MYLGSKDDSEKIVYNDKVFSGIEQLGFTEDGTFIVDIWTTPVADRRGGFFTVLPISPLGHRKEHKTKTKFVRPSSDLLVIHDDWGRIYTIVSEPYVIDHLVDECVKYKTLQHYDEKN
jgi:hypothetical protein